MANDGGDGNSDDDGGRRRRHDNGGGGGVTHEAAGGDAPPLSWRRLHDDGDSGDDNGGGDCDCGGDNDGDKNTDSLLYLLSAPTNSMSPKPSSMGGSNDLLIRSGRLVWALPYHGAGTSEPPPAVHGVSPSHPMETSFGDKLDGTTSPVAGQISQQFARSAARLAANPHLDSLLICFPSATAEPPASGGRPDLDMALDILFWCMVYLAITRKDRQL
jgi:hypothetical protein